MTRRIEVAILERNRLFREGLASILKHANYRIQASAASLEDIGHRDFGVDSRIVFLIGERSEGEVDAVAISHLKRRYLNCHIVLLLDACSDEQRWQAERLGVSGVLLKSISGEVLIRSIELVLMGELVFTAAALPVPPKGGTTSGPLASEETSAPPVRAPNGADILSRHAIFANGISKESAIDGVDGHSVDGHAELSTRRGQLSEREIEILNCLVQGSSNKVIARRCSIAEATVKVHLKAILRKIECANRTQAAVWALNRMKVENASIIQVAPLSAAPERFGPNGISK